MISRSEEQTCEAGKELAAGVELFSDSLRALVLMPFPVMTLWTAP